MDSNKNTVFITLHGLDRDCVSVGDFIKVESYKVRDGWIHLDEPSKLLVNGKPPLLLPNVQQ